MTTEEIEIRSNYRIVSNGKFFKIQQATFKMCGTIADKEFKKVKTGDWDDYSFTLYSTYKEASTYLNIIVERDVSLSGKWNVITDEV